MTIAVIGAGASGMAAALQAAWHGAAVTLFERNASVGRKLLVTGSGRCNITNAAVDPVKYACADQAWMETLISRFGVVDLVDMLSSIGIPVYKTPDGWYYPLSNSAQSVVEAFACALDLEGVTIITQAQVNAIRVSGTGIAIHFSLNGKIQEREFERVIVSAGGTAYPSLGSRGDLFPILEGLGHTVLPNRPALAPLLVELGDLRLLQGVRLDVGATLWNGKKPLASTQGNLIFTEWGLNGPAVMDLSHLVSRYDAPDLKLSLNLLACFQDEFDRLLADKRKTNIPLRVFLDAFFPPKVAANLLGNRSLEEGTPLCQVEDRSLNTLIDYLRDIRLPVKGVRGFEYCQVSAGGVPVGEVEPGTMESRIVKGLYLTGETLDVVGPCGGFNLQYAFSSGALAGKAVSI
ncbi:MAG: aminoacetone oxidase family FAD-binding enzyme [Anaerolineaceae bacterium]|nr:aminoacetone oxidase family FAD-binding enzyme [Anaerolineaceae bacterium]